MVLLYFSLAASAVLLVVENLVARFRPRYVGIASGVGLLGTMVLIHGIAPWSLILQTVIFVVQGGIWQLRGGYGKNLYLGLSVAATFAAYAAFIPAYFQHQEQVTRDRERFPFESMDGRIAPLPETAGEPVVYEAAEADVLEAEIDRLTTFPFTRNRSLRDLHEENVELFIRSEGFGMGRMVYMTDVHRRLENGLHDQPAPLEPGPSTSASSVASASGTVDLGTLKAIHAGGVFDFVNPFGFGYV